MLLSKVRIQKQYSSGIEAQAPGPGGKPQLHHRPPGEPELKTELPEALVSPFKDSIREPKTAYHVLLMDHCDIIPSPA